MRHFLVTRFNVKVNSFDIKDKSGSLILDEDWHRSRFELFDQYCFPSVSHQSFLDFEWCIFFDIDTPQLYKEYLSDLHLKSGKLKVFYVEDADMMMQELRSYITGSVPSGEWFITTRFDNDDVLHKDFLWTVQQHAIKEKSVVDLRSGYQLNLVSEPCELRKFITPFYHFVSLVECNNHSIDTAFCRQHLDWEGRVKVIIFSESPLWIELVHKRNVLNHTHKEGYVLTHFNASDFGINNVNVVQPSIRRFFLNVRVCYYKCFFLFKRLMKRLLKYQKKISH